MEAYQNNSYVLTLKLPDKLQLYGLYVYYVLHICNFGMLRVKAFKNGFIELSISMLGHDHFVLWIYLLSIFDEQIWLDLFTQTSKARKTSST